MDPHLITVDELLAAGEDDPDTQDAPHLISVDELRAAGALDVPEAWRKSLAPESRYTLPGFGDDEDDAEPTEQLTRKDSAHETSSPTHRTHEHKSESAGKPR